ncbi:protein NO VEIN domain-containing protein [Enemella evansiae]|uniref:DUF3883 domain-containing protein n=1 Tax=Enemella evansiae TaxID=2016499 RepID=UPI0011813D79|nr:DUF3883 domain-containing protein [Enemella evansiae]
MPPPWSPEQNEITVAAYLTMLRQELVGQEFQKAPVHAEVAALTGRGAKAVEWKMQNISFVMQLLGVPWIEGYKPARGIQSALIEEVRSQVAGDSDLLSLMEDNVTRRAAPRTDFAWHEVAPPEAPELPEVTQFQFEPMPIDFPRLEAENRALGLAGELAVLNRERQHLRDAGRPDLAEVVEHVSVERGDGAGYDIRSFDLDERERFIEVKTTRRGAAWPMCVTRNEVRFSEHESDRFEMHRVFHFSREPMGIYVLRGAVTETCWLSPLTYRAIPRAA